MPIVWKTWMRGPLCPTRNSHRLGTDSSDLLSYFRSLTVHTREGLLQNGFLQATQRIETKSKSLSLLIQ
jgi:hypothetical protein